MYKSYLVNNRIITSEVISGMVLNQVEMAQTQQQAEMEDHIQRQG